MLSAIKIERTQEVIADMVAVPIDAEFRRKDPLLPRMLYVDARETTVAQKQKGLSETDPHLAAKDERTESISYPEAVSIAQAKGKRLPSAAEYDAIAECIQNRRKSSAASKELTTIDGLFSGVPKWTTTRYRFPGVGQADTVDLLQTMIVLKGDDEVEPAEGTLRTVDGQLLALPNADLPKVGCRFVKSGAPRFVEQ